MTTKNTAIRKGIIYKYTSPVGKSYIGQTIDENKRKATHRKESLTGVSKFYDAVREFGFNNFTYEVLYTIEGTKEAIKPTLDLKEHEYITKYNSAFKGYNSTKGNEKFNDLDGFTKQELKEQAIIAYNAFKNKSTPQYFKDVFIRIYEYSKDMNCVCYYLYYKTNDTVKLKVA